MKRLLKTERPNLVNMPVSFLGCLTVRSTRRYARTHGAALPNFTPPRAPRQPRRPAAVPRKARREYSHSTQSMCDRHWCSTSYHSLCCDTNGPPRDTQAHKEPRKTLRATYRSSRWHFPKQNVFALRNVGTPQRIAPAGKRRPDLLCGAFLNSGTCNRPFRDRDPSGSGANLQSLG